MKTYTDVEQSKKLAEILPPESADMWWAERYAGRVMANGQYIVEEKPVYYPSLTKPSNDNYSQDTIKDVPCWSLSALLDVLPDEVGDNHYLTLDKEGKEYCCCYEDNNGNSFRHCFSDNPVDACTEMIIKLNELKML